MVCQESGVCLRPPTLQILESVFAETVAARGSFFSSASSPK